MTSVDVNTFLEEGLRIRRSLDRATDQLARAENALRVAAARLEALTTLCERAGHEQHPPSA